MATKQIKRNIALTPHLDRLVREKVDSGKYDSPSDVVQDALRLLEQRDSFALMQLKQDLELAWEEGERGEFVDGPSVFAEIRKLSKTRRSRIKES